MAIPRDRHQPRLAARASRTPNAPSDRTPAAIAIRNPALGSSRRSIARNRGDTGITTATRIPTWSPAVLQQTAGAQPTRHRDPRDQVRIDVGEPEDDRSANEDRDGVRRSGAIFLQEHEDREIHDRAVDRTSREVLPTKPLTLIHVRRTVSVVPERTRNPCHGNHTTATGSSFVLARCWVFRHGSAIRSTERGLTAGRALSQRRASVLAPPQGS